MATHMVTDREKRLRSLLTRYVDIHNVKSNESLKRWILEVSLTFNVGAMDAEKGLFLANTDAFIREMQSLSVRAFQLHEMDQFAPNFQEIVSRSMDSILANDDLNGLAAIMDLYMQAFQPRPRNGRPINQFFEERKTSKGQHLLLPLAAKNGATQCVYMLTTKYHQYLEADDSLSNADFPVECKSFDPVHQAAMNESLDILRHLLYWENLKFAINDYTNVTTRTEEMQEFVKKYRDHDTIANEIRKIVLPFDTIENKKKWDDVKAFVDDMKARICFDPSYQFLPRGYEIYGEQENEIRFQLAAIEEVVRGSFLDIRNLKDQFKIFMEENPVMQVWENSIKTYKQVMIFAQSQFGYAAWDKAIHELLFEIESTWFDMMLPNVPNPLPFTAPQPIRNLILSYKDIFRTQQGLRMILMDIAAQTHGELSCNDPKGLARSIEKVTLSMIYKIIKPKVPKEVTPPDPSANRQFIVVESEMVNLRQEYNKKMSNNIDYDHDNLWDLWDYTRGMLIYRTIPGITNALTQIHMHEDLEIVNIDNHFGMAGEVSGWQDMKVHVKINKTFWTKGGADVIEIPLICEVQLVLEPLLIARRSLGGHDTYSAFRLASAFKTYIDMIDKVDEKEDLNLIFQDIGSYPMISRRFAPRWNPWEVPPARAEYLRNLYRSFGAQTWNDLQPVVEEYAPYLGTAFDTNDWAFFWGLFNRHEYQGSDEMPENVFIASRAFYELASIHIRDTGTLHSLQALPDEIARLL